MTHIMLDIETMGTGNDAAVIQIGAVPFDLYGEPNICYGFVRSIDLQSCLDAGLTVTGATIKWWMQQDPDAQERVILEPNAGTVPLREALGEFSNWMAGFGKPINVWGNDSCFDNVILRNAFDAVGMKHPWSYKGDRSMRTLLWFYRDVCGLPRVNPTFVGVQHDGLDDAVQQAKIVAAQMKAISALLKTGHSLPFDELSGTLP
jgi:hypothetical protein